MKKLLTSVLAFLFIISGSVSRSPLQKLTPEPVRADIEGSRKAGKMSMQQRQAIEHFSTLLEEIDLDENEVPVWLSGELGPASGKPKEAAIEAMRRLKPLFRATDQDQFEPRLEMSDDIGQTHVRLRQRYHGLQVLGSELIVHTQNGKVIGVNGKFVPDIDIDVSPSLASSVALDSRALTLSF
jgi:Zn-dependent metalloprotease